MNELTFTYETPALVEVGDFADLTLGGDQLPCVDVITDAYNV